MKIELKYLLPYLPYRLTYMSNVSGLPKEVVLSNIDLLLDNYVKPILRPLYDFTKEIKHNEAVFVPRQRLIEKYFGMEYRSSQPEKYIDKCLEYLKEPNGYNRIPYWMFQDLIKWHFDIFGLISNGLAVDINY